MIFRERPEAADLSVNRIVRHFDAPSIDLFLVFFTCLPFDVSALPAADIFFPDFFTQFELFLFEENYLYFPELISLKIQINVQDFFKN